MTTEKAIEILNSVKNGTFGTIEYVSSLPVNKEAKKSGIKIFCRTRKMVRFGASYKNIVKEVSSGEVKPRTNNYTWVVGNKVSHNSSTDKDYVRVSSINRKTISRVYSLVDGSGVTSEVGCLDDVLHLLQPSYANKSGVKPVVQNISVDNIVSINGIA